MVHECVGLVLQETKPDINAKVSQMMAPFNEHTSENGMWDWYEIGGRWDGCFGGKNSVLVKDYCDKARKNHLEHFLLPDGKWHSRKKWNGVDFIEDKNWFTTIQKLLEPYQDHYIVAVDFHW